MWYVAWLVSTVPVTLIFIVILAIWVVFFEDAKNKTD